MADSRARIAAIMLAGMVASAAGCTRHGPIFTERSAGGDGSTTDADVSADVSPVACSLVWQGDLEDVGRLMSREFDLRRGLAPGVSTERIEDLLGVARQAGAWGGEVCGAGGGGCVAILSPPGIRLEVERALAQRGAQLLAAGPVTSPLEVTVS